MWHDVPCPHGLFPPPLQGILLASIPTCAVGYMGMGWALDRGLRAVYANVVLTAAGSAAGERWAGGGRWRWRWRGARAAHGHA